MDKLKVQIPAKEKPGAGKQVAQAGPGRERLTGSSGLAALQRVIDHPDGARPTDVIALRRVSGNLAASRLVQTRLMVGPAGDAYEQEADRVAEQVISGPLAAAGQGVQRREDAEEVQTKRVTLQRQEGEEEFQAKSLSEASLAGFRVNDQFEDQLKASRGNGEPLPEGLRAEVEPRFGADLSGVRVHHSSRDAEMSRSISAQAFTLGQDIYMGAGKYDPSSTAGKRLLAHELTHTIQQGAARQSLTQRMTHITPQISAKRIQRKTLSPDSILSALLKIPFIKDKLKQTQHLRRDDTKDKGPKAETMLAHVKEVLGMYSKNLRVSSDKDSSQAISLAVVLEAVARIIAVNELNDPGLTPILTGELILLYRDEIASALGKMDNKENIILQARALIAGDPIGQYMHNELRIEEAARQVRKMAMLAGQDPVAFFDLLRQRFEIEMATQTEAKTRSREDKSGAYNVKEATGEISVEYLKKLFPQIQRGKKQPAQVNPTWKKGETKGARNELVFTPEAAQKLDALKTAVGVHDPGFTGQRRQWMRQGETQTNSLTTRQSAHLAEIEQKEAQVDIGNLDEIMLEKLKMWYALDNEGAALLLGKIKSGLASLPIALTVKAGDWFSGGSPSTTIYKPGSSRRKEANFADLFGKTGAKGKINYLGDFQDTSGQGRHKNYGRFRNWKDQLMAGNRGFSDKELPSFAAVQINWEARSSAKGMGYGENSYGDLHFVLKKNNIANRLVYTATDHGHPRRNIYLALLDFILGDTESKSLTGLKKTENETVVRQIINSLTTKQLLYGGVPCFEIQIFGELDVAKDVEAIAVAPSVGNAIKANIQKFCGDHNINYEEIAKPTEAVLTDNWFGEETMGRNLRQALKVEQIRKLYEPVV